MASEKDITYPPAEAADNGSTSGNPQSQQHVDETLAQLEDPSSTQLSIRAILQGNATHPLTAFEKKAALINVELDSFGLGRYQICIWFLCGFGYFLDLAWSQGVGLAATAIYQEMNVPDGQTGKIYSLANAGLAVGAFSWGILVDIIGRKWAFNLTCLITSVFGLILVCSSSPFICRYMYIYIYSFTHDFCAIQAAPKFNYNAICGIYFLASIGLGGNIPIDATIALEYLPQNRRNLVTLLSLWQPIGVVFASAVAYGTAAKPSWRCDDSLPSCVTIPDGQARNSSTCCTVDSNMGWRYLFIILGVMTLVIFFLRYFIFHLYESPKFLLSHGREQEAIDVLHKIAYFNKAPPPTLTLEMFQAIDETSSPASSSSSVVGGVASDSQQLATRGEKLSTARKTQKVLRNFARGLGNLKALFSNPLQAFIFILLAIAYMGDYWSFNLAGSFLPIILLRNEVSDGSGSVAETYRHYIYIYLPGILGAVLGLVSVQLPLVGRKWSLVISAILQGVAMAMYTQVYTTAGYVGLNAFEYIMQTVSGTYLTSLTYIPYLPVPNVCPRSRVHGVADVASAVLQCSAICFCSRALRYLLSRQRKRDALVSGSH